MKLFTRAFWTNAAETALVAGSAAFAGSGLFSTPPSDKSFAAAGIAAGMAALYSFIKQLGGVQSFKAVAAKGAAK